MRIFKTKKQETHIKGEKIKINGKLYILEQEDDIGMFVVSKTGNAEFYMWDWLEEVKK